MGSESIRKHEGMVQVYPTTRGWTVRAIYWEDYPNGFQQKRWTGIKEPQIADHRFTDLSHRFSDAVAWLDETTNQQPSGTLKVSRQRRDT